MVQAPETLPHSSLPVVLEHFQACTPDCSTIKKPDSESIVLNDIRMPCLPWPADSLCYMAELRHRNTDAGLVCTETPVTTWTQCEWAG